MNIRLIVIVWLMTLSAILSVSASNTVALTTVGGQPGENVSVAVSLTSDVSIVGIQLSLQLPEGTTYVSGSASTTGRASTFAISGGVRQGLLNITLYSTKGASVIPGEGEIATFSLNLGPTPLSCTLETDVILSDATGRRIDSSVEPVSFAIAGASLRLETQKHSLGRVALGEEQTLTVTVANSGPNTLEITGLQTDAGGIWSLADDRATVAPQSQADVTLQFMPQVRGAVADIVRFISNAAGTTTPLIVHSEGFGRNEISLSSRGGQSDSEATVAIFLKNYDPITGMTLHLHLPEGFSYVDGSFILGSRAQGHGVTATTAPASDGNGSIVTLMAYSLTNKPFEGHIGELATMKVRIATRYGNSIDIASAVLPALIDGKVTDVVSATSGAYLSVISPVISCEENIDMGRIPITEDAVVSIPVSNYGAAPLIISSYSTLGTNFVTANKLPLTIESGETAMLDFVYAGKEEGSKQSTITLVCNDPESRAKAVAVKMDRYSPNELSFECMPSPMGSAAVVRVMLSNNDTVEGLQFDFNYPTNCFAFNQVIPTARGEGLSIIAKELSPGIVRVMAYGMGRNIAPGFGQCMELHLTPFEDKTEGKYDISAENFIISDAKMVNKYSGEEKVKGVIEITKLLGDLNHDGLVDKVDVDMLISGVANVRNYNDFTEGDINSDREVNIIDVNILINSVYTTKN